MTDEVKFCEYCGSPITRQGTPDGGELLECIACHKPRDSRGSTSGPALLVLILIFASDRILLLKRGSEPYQGKWAPPGGFVEHAESLETAAIREVWEETRIELGPEQLVPHAVISIPTMNQVYHVFKVCLQRMVPASSVLPESLDVNWYSEPELTALELWGPGADVDVAALFEGVRTGRFDFFQRNDVFWRVITERCRIKYLWQKAGRDGRVD